ncbi:MAG: diheme cytochrome c [Ideonella sp.]|nr:diheme cytochrome c [Ideonella sp.]
MPAPHRPRPRQRPRHASPLRRTGLCLLLTAAAAACAAAGVIDRDDTVAAPQLPAYVQDCAACHMAYPPGLLPATSWQHLMANLPRHFGTDASLDPRTLKVLSEWLVANAGSFRRVVRDPVQPPQDRISQSTWFVQKHREIDARVWRRPAIGSAARCDACHSAAEQGQFSEHDVYMPK